MIKLCISFSDKKILLTNLNIGEVGCDNSWAGGGCNNTTNAKPDSGFKIVTTPVENLHFSSAGKRNKDLLNPIRRIKIC